MGDWTPEPWEVDVMDSGNIYVIGPEATIGHLHTVNAPCEANARRIVACVNALEGWTTEALEQLAAPIADQLRERDERIRKLEEALKAARHGELCSDWDNCDFLKLLYELLGEG